MGPKVSYRQQKEYYYPDLYFGSQQNQLAISDADTFLTSINYSGPSGKYSLTTIPGALVIGLKTKFDEYNNNISCP